MLVEDIDKEFDTAGGARWDPSFPLSTALIPDPGASDDLSFGSLFIFRKLEQDVAPDLTIICLVSRCQLRVASALGRILRKLKTARIGAGQTLKQNSAP